MPVELVDESELKQIRRGGKVTRLTEWKQIEEKLEHKLPSGKALRITLSDATIKSYGTGDAAKKKALMSFRQKLNREYGKQYRIQVVGDEIGIKPRK